MHGIGRSVHNSRMGSVNRVVVLGRVGRAPEIKALSSGERFACFDVATSESWQDKTTDTKKERVEWHRIVAFGEMLVGVVEKYLKRGTKVYIEGRLQTRKWKDASGNERLSTDIVLRQYRGEIIVLDDKTVVGSSVIKTEVDNNELALLSSENKEQTD